jgi:predicted membrane channel-forming protein YqfA (hemolysin III family)
MIKITNDALRNVTIILFIAMSIISMLCPSLRYQAFLGFITIEMILGIYYILTNRDIKRKGKIIRIFLYIVIFVVSIYIINTIA